MKRLRYFDQQFLVEADFTDEQKYHVDMRRRLTKALHSVGIAEGLTVRRTGAREITVDPGVAIDAQGREIVLNDPEVRDVSNTTTFPNGPQIFITIAYGEVPSDPVTATGVTGDTRITEAPVVAASTTVPPIDGTVVRLAVFSKGIDGNIPGNPNDQLDGGVRQLAGAKTAAGAVTDISLAAGAVTETKIGDGAVTLAKLAPNSVDATRIVDASVGANELANNAVTTAKIADGAVTLAKLAANSVDATKIVDATVGTNELANNAVTSAKLQDGAVTTAKVVDGTVTTAKIVDGAVTTAKIPDGAVTDAKIASGTITEARLAAAVVSKLNAPSGLGALNNLTGSNIEIVGVNAITVVPVPEVPPTNGGGKIRIGESHSAQTGNVHGLTALSSQYDLRARSLNAMAFTHNDANGKQTVLNLSFAPRIVFCLSNCTALLGSRVYGGTSVGMFDALIGNQRCVGFGITWNSNADWFPRGNVSTTGICSAAVFDGSTSPARSEDVSVAVSAAGNALTATLTRTIVGSGNSPLANFQLIISMFVMGM
jgi:hypothetical protein